MKLLAFQRLQNRFYQLSAHQYLLIDLMNKNMCYWDYVLTRPDAQILYDFDINSEISGKITNLAIFLVFKFTSIWHHPK